ncbi:hypothetical protein PsorP6_010985 [Peronosclerospora sorghi]|uniref:Uncharacterized protein n=1 Tax=Peronosclerospora sorghi TaxID=230839 RepID=A0ACC0VWG3_9STRA|nr:hypothetical protein PsorP6_010985 [Peronosclerospora sorghi]
MRPVVDEVHGILTGSPQAKEAKGIPRSVPSRPTEGASEDMALDRRRGALARLLDERSQIRSPETLVVESSKALGGHKVVTGSGVTSALQNAESLQGRWYDKGKLSVDRDNSSSQDMPSLSQIRREVAFVYGSDPYVVCALVGKTYGK